MGYFLYPEKGIFQAALSTVVSCGVVACPGYASDEAMDADQVGWSD